VSGHTPGPWRIAVTKTTIVVADAKDDLLPHSFGEIEHYGGRLVAESIFNPANVRLIAAAPRLFELLARLHDAVYVRPHDFDGYHQDWMAARELLRELGHEVPA
jgi:hypothetical protein